MRELEELEALWTGQSDDERYFGFQPFALPDFRGYLRQTLALFEPDRFVDVGCGIGSKILAVQEELDVVGLGIDRVPEFVAEARRLGVDAEEGDAFDWTGYRPGDLVYLNCPCVPRELEAELEQRVFAHLPSGAAIWLVNAVVQPEGWSQLWLDWDCRAGAWLKGD
jgi:trans-aconitate methyltransferase